MGLLLDLPVEHFRQFVDHDRLGFAVPDQLEAWRVDDLCDDYPFTPAQIPCVFQWKSSRFAHALRKLLETQAFSGVEFFEYCGPGYYTFVDRLFDPSPSSPTPPVMFTRLHGSIEVLERFGAGLCCDESQFRQFALEQRSLWLSEAVLTPTRAYFDRYFKNLYRIEPERAVVSSPPKQAFPRVARRPTADEPFRIVFIGRLFHLKGVDQLVHAAVMLMKARPELDFSVEMIGYDSTETPACNTYGEYLRTLIPERYRSRFIFAGQVPHARIAETLEHALFGVFPNRIESFCYALHEVYDAGVPVVVNDLPAFSDFFTHERNCLTYDGTTRDLCSQMLRMVDDSSLRDRLTKPYAVAEHPIGDFYAAPFAVRPLVPTDPHPS
ncbi:MAG: glycosyltransferase family 4 protein, partial [bacterium]|nr:glycosyltransferase family 4 protein [bacterium]